MAQKYNISILAGQLVVGGAERQLYLWLSYLDREKFQPVVLTLHPGCGDYWEESIEALGIPLLRIPRRRDRMARLQDIVKGLRPYHPQLIQGWHLFASPYAGAAAKVLGARSLGGLRDTFHSLSKTPLASALTLYMMDAILANSRTAAQGLRSGWKRKDQVIYAVQNAVEDQKFLDRLEIRGELSRKFGISPSGIWIGSLGRLDPKKKLEFQMKVFSSLREDVKDLHYLLIGDGPERGRLEGLVKEMGIEGLVTFVGEVPAGSAWLRALDIFCFTSLDEGLPNAVMEAAVAGVPVVSWRLPFMEELLDNGKAAYLAEPEDPEAFKAILLKLIRSPELRVKMGAAGRRHMLENFTLDRYIHDMTAVYEDILGIRPVSKLEAS